MKTKLNLITPSKQTNVLEIKNLNKIANDKGRQILLKNVSFSIPRGSLTVLIGENGAGKSTTIKSIVGLYTFNSGEILLNGISNKNINTHFKLSYIPEKENFPKISANIFL